MDDKDMERVRQCAQGYSERITARRVGAGDGGTYVVGEQWYQSEVERLQRELATASEMIASMQAQRNQAAREREEQWQARVKAERERDEARAKLERVTDAASGVLAHHMTHEHEGDCECVEYRALRAALGGEG